MNPSGYERIMWASRNRFKVTVNALAISFDALPIHWPKVWIESTAHLTYEFGRATLVLCPIDYLRRLPCLSPGEDHADAEQRLQNE